MTIDTTFVFTQDTPPGKDPDADSPTLRQYHKILWSKPLPCGQQLDLSDKTKRVYLHHNSALGEFFFASDAVIPSFSRERKIQNIIQSIPAEDLSEFNSVAYTIGAIMLFPGNQIARQMTINQARGCHPRIKDRFDLTLECIKRHYENRASPLDKVLGRYSNFFALFEDFRGYVDFFLLADLVHSNTLEVLFFTEFDNFQRSPLPQSISEYNAYRNNAMHFINQRNKRISKA